MESGTPTVFTQTGGSDMGEVTVDADGRLYFPYVGALRVTGMTIGEVRNIVMRRLRTVVLGPQVDIRLVDKRSMLVSVQGNAGKTGAYPIIRGRSRLGELLAEVAPDQKNPEMLNVTLRRGGEAATVRLSDVYKNPRWTSSCARAIRSSSAKWWRTSPCRRRRRPGPGPHSRAGLHLARHAGRGAGAQQ